MHILIGGAMISNSNLLQADTSKNTAANSSDLFIK
jgi:hypothetical protein